MTSDDISELERLERAATAGPWRSVGDVYIFGADDEPFDQTESDVALIVAARNALPELLAMARDYARWKAKGYDYTVEDLSHQVDGFREMAARDAADLLATRRALKLAQAKGLHVLYLLATHHWTMNLDWESDKRHRGYRLIKHYAAKFEREAGEVK
jgi:hypothetical protein